MRYHVRLRRFLNRLGHEAGAYVLIEVPDSATCASSCEHAPFDDCRDIVVKISDCYRVVNLDFAVDTAAERRNSLHKVDVLLDALHQLRDALELEGQRAAEASATRSRR